MGNFGPEGIRLCPAGIASTDTTACLPFGEEKIFEVLGPSQAFIVHRQFNIPSRDFGDAAHGGSDAVGCVAAVRCKGGCTTILFGMLLPSPP